MGSTRGFLDIPRAKAEARPVKERLKDYKEFESSLEGEALKGQASRCMDCGVPYCHNGCPLGNLIPDFNDLVYRGQWEEAVASLHATNNFPEFTGRICPAPCEASCTLNIEKTPVTIKYVERAIAKHAVEEMGIKPQLSPVRTGRKVAVVGSGPAGLAAAQQLARLGHDVDVLEKNDRIGGLLRYGIPDFKLEKSVIDRRLEQMREEGVRFMTKVHVGVDIKGEELREKYDAIVLCGGAERPRDLQVEGRELKGIHFAMEFLMQNNKRVAGDQIPAAAEILATGKNVVVLGGGDTGSDCVGTSLRQGAKSVTSLELMPRPPDERAERDMWPAWPHIFRTSSSHEEGGSRDFAAMTTKLMGDENGNLKGLEAVRVQFKDGNIHLVKGSEFQVPCELIFLAMGFVSPTKEGLIEQLGVQLDQRGNVVAKAGYTSVPGVFAAGDMARGQSLVVWAIAEGRKTAASVHHFLTAEDRRLENTGS